MTLFFVQNTKDDILKNWKHWIPLTLTVKFWVNFHFSQWFSNFLTPSPSVVHNNIYSKVLVLLSKLLFNLWAFDFCKLKQRFRRWMFFSVPTHFNQLIYSHSPNKVIGDSLDNEFYLFNFCSFYPIKYFRAWYK